MISSLWALIVIVGGGILSVLAAYFAGKRGKTVDEAQSRADTFERASHADTGNPDGSTDLDWLRKRGK